MVSCTTTDQCYECHGSVDRHDCSRYYDYDNGTIRYIHKECHLKFMKEKFHYTGENDE